MTKAELRQRKYLREDTEEFVRNVLELIFGQRAKRRQIRFVAKRIMETLMLEKKH